MHVLIAYHTRYGSTRGIAERVTATLSGAGLETTLGRIEEVHDLAGYDAFVIGSAVFAFHWPKAPVRFLERNQVALRGLPVWLFSVGPLGPKAPSPQKSRDYDHLSALASAREHQIFYGAVDISKLRGPDRLFARFLKSVEGDWRDWPEIEAWAAKIAGELTRVPVGETAG